MSKYTPSNLVNTRISKILVAIDGSERSFKASEYALELAKSFGAQLYAVTVTHIPTYWNLSQKEILCKSLVEDSSNNSMIDAGPWDKITRGLPKGNRYAHDRAPTLEEISKYPDRRIKPLVYTIASSGIRVGTCDYLHWGILHQSKKMVKSCRQGC
ncbi:MAG: universal stress protein [Candidatus Nitrosopolaris sp.]